MSRTSLLLLCLLLQKQPTANKQSSQEQVQKPATNQTVPDVRQEKPEAVVTQARPVENQVHSETPKKNDWAQAVREVNDSLLVIFTGVLAYVGYLQWKTLREHGRWMKENVKIAKEAAGAAKESADAAYASSEFTRYTIKESERAEVLLRSAEINSNSGALYESWLELTVKNFGRSSAIEVSGHFEFINAAPLMPSRVSILHTILGAGQEHVFIFKKFIQLFNGHIFGRMASGQQVLQFSGVITYRDIFDESHTTRCAGTFDHGTVRFIISENIAS